VNAVTVARLHALEARCAAAELRLAALEGAQRELALQRRELVDALGVVMARQADQDTQIAALQQEQA
jgi:hypothetical protein